MKMPRRLRRIAVFVIAFAAGLWVADRLFSSRLIAETTTAPAAEATTRFTIDADVAPVLQRITTAYAKGPVELSGSLSLHFDVAGIVDQRQSALSGIANSANLFVHQVENEVQVVGDGKSVHVLDVKQKVYVSKAVADGGSSTVNELVSAMLREQNPALLAATSGDASTALFAAGATVSLDREKSTEQFDVLSSTEGFITRTCWVDKKSGLIDRVESNFAELLAQQGAKEIKHATATIRYDKTAFDVAHSADRFAFEPPADATEAPAAGEMMTAEGGDAQALVGQVAPDFTLKDLDGAEISLASLKGKVVVLDFWATWCPPCVKAMPHLAKIGADYAAKDVVVLAVNQREEAQTVKAFLESNKLALRALLDADGMVGQRFRVSGIPQTVVIGKDGNVRQVLVGFTPDYATQLEDEIAAALK